MPRFLVRFGEIGVKSAPVRKRFTAKLAANIRAGLARDGVEADVERTWSRLYVTGDDADSIADVLARTFGIVSFSRIWLAEADPDRIADRAVELMRERFPDGEIGSFGVRPRRHGDHGFSSQDVGVVVGAAVEEAFDAPVDLDDPDTGVFVEVRDNSAYVFFDKTEGPGGLPVASQGRVVLAGGPGAALAAWLVMKRGAEVVPVVRAGEEATLEPLTRWAPRLAARVVEDAPDDLGEWLAVVDGVGFESDCDAIVVGFHLGEGFAERFRQVSEVCQLPVLSPLTGFDEETRAELAEETGLVDDAEPPGTFETPVVQPKVEIREVDL